MDPKGNINRREFLAPAAAGLALTLVPRHVLGGAGFVAPSERVNIAGIGAGGMGGGDIATVARLGANIVALCDVDEDRLSQAAAMHSRAARFVDFRKLLEQQKLDAVVVSTPD